MVGKQVIKTLMFAGSIVTMIFGGIIGHVAYTRADIGILGILLGVFIFFAGGHSAWDLYRTFYVRQDK